MKQQIHKLIITLGIILILLNLCLRYFGVQISFFNPWLFLVIGLDIYYLKKANLIVIINYNEFKIKTI